MKKKLDKSKVCSILMYLSAGCFLYSADGNNLVKPETESRVVKPLRSKTEDIQVSEDVRNDFIGVDAAREPETADEQIKRLREQNRILRKQLRDQADAFQKRQADLDMAEEAERTELEEENIRLKADLSRIQKTLAQTEREKSLLMSAGSQIPDGNGRDFRKELLEMLEKNQANLERLKTLEMSVASVIDTLEPVYVSSRETEMAETLDLVLKNGMKLAGKSLLTAEMMLKLVPEMKVDEKEKAKIRTGLDELRKNAAEFAKLDVSPEDAESFESCRVLELNKELGVAVLSAGYRNGVRVNLSVIADNAEKTRLRVVSVRGYVCAAVPEDGALDTLSPGMPVTAGR